MTRQNAIKWLKDYRKNTDFEMPQYEEALDMAIKALSHEQIRAEIETIDVTMGIKDYPFIPKAKVLEIIDKYKGE